MLTITLATLAQATPQQVFDQAVSGVITQGRPSIDGSWNCLYRSPEGLACAAGQLMSDEEASSLDDNDSDSTAWVDLIYDGKVPDVHMNLIASLQYCHDTADRREGAFVNSFRDAARRCAADYGLDDKVARC